MDWVKTYNGHHYEATAINLLVESLVPFGIQSDNFILKSFGNGGFFSKPRSHSSIAVIRKGFEISKYLKF